MTEHNQYLPLFLEEAQEYLNQLNGAILALEKQGPTTSLLDDIFRVAHTLKSMAAAMGFEGIKGLSHDRKISQSTETLFGLLEQCVDQAVEQVVAEDPMESLSLALLDLMES